jgi:uncharacterized membrane protein YecN with MAPEG domain
MNTQVTGLYAALLAIFYVVLAFAVVRQRMKLRVGLGDGQQPALIKAIRIHGNFAEYVPFALLLLLILEQKAGLSWQLHLIGGLILGGRLLHAFGLMQSAGTSPWRFLGMVSTFTALLVSAGLLLWQSV